MQPISTFVGNLGYVGVAILGGYLAMNGSITIGDIQSFITYVRSFNQPISMIAQNMVSCSPRPAPQACLRLPGREGRGAGV